MNFACSEREGRHLKILILGGTVFLGRHIVEAALERGHEVTIFNRGRHNPDLFPQVEHLQGDRDGDLVALRGRSWDAVIDTSGYVPRVVRASAELLEPAVKEYVFISTISVYADTSRPGTNEETPVGRLDDETVEEVTGETYGPLKALCEQVVEEVYPGRALIIRPGLIVGPDDPTDRFTYWPRRVAAGGTVLAPGRPETPVQFIDVRDLAGWTIRMVEEHRTGVYNATGPDRELSLGEVLETSKAVTESDAEIVWVPEAFLLERDVAPWSELPLWLPDTEEYRGFHRNDVGRALGAGLTFRPLADTIRDTLNWDADQPADRELQAGMEAEREAALLREWEDRS